MRVALRDDDTSFFTDPDRLDAVYHDVWDRLPVCLAVIPRAAGFRDKAIPEKYWRAGRSFPLEENPSLVECLRSLIRAGKITIAQHGYTHEDFATGSEFEAAPDLETRLWAGRSYLHQTLGVRVKIFVPPHNALSKRGLAAVGAQRLNLLGSFLSFRPSMRPWDRHTASNWLRVRRYRASLGLGKSDPFIYPHVLRYRRHAEFGCHSLIPGTTLEDLVAGFERARRDGGDFCIATHYWEVDVTIKEVLQRFLDHAARVPGVRFVAADELFEAA